MSKNFLIRIPALLLFVTLIAGCASKFHLQPESFEQRRSSLTKEIRTAQQITDFKGSGTITAVEDGRRSSGKCDVRFKPDGSFRAQIYSPFGSTAARIDADSLGGSLRAGKDEYSFSLDESMETLPFVWGSYFTFRQFIQIITGKMPEEKLALLDSRPDSLEFDKSSAIALWNRDMLTAEARIGRKSGTVESVTFNYDISGGTFALSYSRFKNGVPGEITIRSDSKNYISLRYDR